MPNSKIFLLFIFLITSFAFIAISNNLRVYAQEENRNGCPWVSYSTYEHEKPSDLAGLIVYGLRGLFGKNKHLIAHYNCPPDVTKLTLSRTVIYKDCENKENFCSHTTDKIDVSVEMFDQENDVATYDYEISAGKIIGRGARVVWNLSQEKIGHQTITVGVDDGQGVIGKKMTQEIKILECENCN